MELPKLFLESIDAAKGFNRTAFEEVHRLSERITSIRINAAKFSEKDNHFQLHNKVPWAQAGYYLQERPSFTFDPLFHAGCYYVQEASSMFLEQAVKQLVDLSKPLKALDLCAAPGGKSTHLLSLISNESLLVSNEVIRSRLNVLNDNIVKWGNDNVIISNNDARSFQQLKNYFDLIVVDAPCSGSGLFRRNETAIDEWSLNNVNLCSGRQQRILADVLPALKENGILIYSTCSYSQKENEEIGNWLENELEMKHETLKLKEDWGIVETEFGYRFWPDRLKGEGFFLGCFRKINTKIETESYNKTKRPKLEKINNEFLKSWLQSDEFIFFQQNQNIHAINSNHFSEIDFLMTKLRIENVGIKMGMQMKRNLIPDHALAMSNFVSNEVAKLELDFEQAIQYLKKEEVKINEAEKGWKLATFKGHNLGWINVLEKRINNYYPKALRILKN